MPNSSSHSRPIQSNVSGRECRIWLRFPSRRIASCQFADADNDSSWPVQVHDVSRTGFSLLSARKFEPGTVLKIGDIKESDSPATLVAARVNQVTPAPGEKWTIGCVFLKELSDQELLAWLKEQP